MATPTAPWGSPEGTTVPAAPRSGHPRLPHLTPRLTLKHGSTAPDSPSLPPEPAAALATGVPAALELAAETHFQGTHHMEAGQTGVGAPAAACSPPSLQCCQRSASGLPAKTPGLQGDWPPSAPVCSLAPPFLVR